MLGCGALAPSGPWGATVTVADQPAEGTVLFVNGTGAVVAQASIVHGRYQLATPPTAMVAEFRIDAPYAGVRDVQLTSDAPPLLEIGTRSVLTLHAGIEMPKSETFDWVDLEVKPIDSKLGWTFKRHVTTARTDLRLIAGRYLINAYRKTGDAKTSLVLDHFQDGAESPTAPHRISQAGELFMIEASLGGWFVLRHPQA